jgi:hypothetical protein
MNQFERGFRLGTVAWALLIFLLLGCVPLTVAVANPVEFSIAAGDAPDTLSIEPSQASTRAQ